MKRLIVGVLVIIVIVVVVVVVLLLLHPPQGATPHGMGDATVVSLQR
jgi:preprotein translocase subunit SecG